MLHTKNGVFFRQVCVLRNIRQRRGVPENDEIGYMLKNGERKRKILVTFINM